jgi:PAS domain S-box-containing protein
VFRVIFKLSDGSHRENLSGFDDRLRYISTALFGAGMLAVLLVANSGLVPYETMNRAALNWVVAAAGVSVVGILLFPWRRYNRNLFLIASLVGLCLITLAIYFSGGWESPFFPFYFFVVVFCALYFSPRVAALVVLLTVLVSLSPQLYAPDAARLAEHIMVRVPTFLAVAIVSWYMAREVGRRERLRGEYEFQLQDLQEREARYRSIFDSNVLGLFFWEAEGSILRANDAFLGMLGYTREDLQGEGLSWRELTPEEYRPLDDEKLAEALDRGVCQPFEKEYFRKDGSRVPVLLAVALLEGYRDRGVCFTLDLTERKRAEEALKESEERFRLMVQKRKGLRDLHA